MDLDALNIFLTVAQHGSFSEAGRRLHLTQPAISQIIRGLERDLGVELFSRQGRSVRLTEAGQVLKPMASELLNSARRLRETMLSLHGEVIGEITMGCSTASGKYLLPGLIARFRRVYPRVRVNVLVSSRESVIKKLLANDFQLAVSSKVIEHEDLEYQNFFMDHVILIASANHRWASYPQIYPDDLLDEPIILREDAAGTREVMIEGLRRADITPDMLNVAMVLGNAEAIEMAVEEGIGVAFVSRLAALRGLELGRIVEVTVHGMELNRNIYLLRNRKIVQSRLQSEYWDYICSAFPATTDPAGSELPFVK